jgi:gliding motility-associated lipoprotein GldH
MLRNIIFLCILFSSCKKDILFVSSIPIPDQIWSYEKPLKFQWVVTDTIDPVDLLLTLKHGLEFPKQNLYTKFITTFPDSTNQEQILSLELFRSNGEPNGKCNSKSCLTTIILDENIRFSDTGNYSIEILQYSREKDLHHIQEVTFEIVKSKKKN